MIKVTLAFLIKIYTPKKKLIKICLLHCIYIMHSYLFVNLMLE